jgi:hypothetical protein
MPVARAKPIVFIRNTSRTIGVESEKWLLTLL